MIIGIPREIKADEGRVGIVPSGVAAFTAHGHKVLVEKGAGLISGIPDTAFRASGAQIITTAKAIWERADLVMKVKEPLGEELEWMRPGQMLYCFLHLAGNEALTHTLIRKKVIGIAFETIQLEDGSLPLLSPMSEVAGRLAVQKGDQCLEASAKGMGILISGVSGVRPANIVILGAGVAGSNACYVANGMGARVTVIDINMARLRYLHDVTDGHITTLMSNRANIFEEVERADLVIGTVLIPGAKTPRLIPRELVRRMKSGAVMVDVAIDQGGCCETSHPTTHHDPIYHLHDVVHYCVANMPGAVPRTCTYALANVTLGYGLALADKGVEKAMAMDIPLKRGINVYEGKVTYKAVAEAFGMTYCEV